MRPTWILLALATSSVPAFAADSKDERKPELVLDLGGHTDTVRKVLFRPPLGKELITVSEDKTVRIWSVKTGACLKVIRLPLGPGEYGSLYAGAVSADGELLAVSGVGYSRGGKRVVPIYVLSLSSGKLRHVLKGHTALVEALAFSPNGKLLASGSRDNTARIWDLASGKSKQELSGHAERITDLTFSPGGQRLVTASRDHTARIWSVPKGTLIQELKHQQSGVPANRLHVQGVAWSPDAKTIA